MVFIERWVVFNTVNRLCVRICINNNVLVLTTIHIANATLCSDNYDITATCAFISISLYTLAKWLYM